MVGIQITADEAMWIAKKKGLKPARVKGEENSIQFTNGRDDRLEMVNWDEFKRILHKENLGLFKTEDSVIVEKVDHPIDVVLQEKKYENAAPPKAKKFKFW